MVSSPPVEVDLSPDENHAFLFLTESGNDAVSSVGNNAFFLSPHALRQLATQAERAADTLDARMEADE